MQARIRPLLAVLAVALVAMVVVACGDDKNSSTTAASTAASTTADATTTAASGKLIVSNPANGKTPAFTIGSKNFTEAFILGNIYSQALTAAGYKVKTQLNLGSEQIAYKALKGGQVDAYPEYTGTALTSFYKVKPEDVPKDPQAAFEQVKAGAAKDDITALPPTDFTDSNGFAMTQAKAKQLGITNISDLKAKASTLTIAGPPECRQRVDCLLGLEQVYGLKFKKFIPVDLAKRHEVLTNGQADVSLVFTTDGQIKTENLQLLNDDKKMLPPYNSTLLVRNQTIAAAGPDFAKTVALVQGGLTTPVMQELNSRVDLDKQKPADVAHEYLTESGYLK
jgi:glycine betaine/choline ABC-type transport system substrate-binding protein